MMKQLEVQIMGQSYLLGCPPDGDARLLDAVNRVDLAMCKIRDSGKIKARDRIAVLAALNLAFDVPEAPKAQTEIVQLAVTPSQESAQLTALLARLDTALGQDGQLL
jgi:cell division protein ZapA